MVVSKFARNPILSGSIRRCSPLSSRSPVIFVSLRSTPSSLSSLSTRFPSSPSLSSPHTRHFIRFYSTPIPTPSDSTQQPIYSQNENGITSVTPAADGSISSSSSSSSLSSSLDPSQAVDATSGVSEVVVPVTVENFSTFPPVVWCGELMQWAHHASGLPWWATIMAATLVVRLSLFPVMAKVMKNNLKLASVKPVLDSYQAKIRMGVTPQQRDQATRDLYAYMAKEGVQPWKSMLGVLAQAPVFMLFYFTLKGLTENNIDHMDTGGALWFPDLTLPDPYYILSVCTAASFIAAIELGADTGQSMAKTASFIKNIFRFLGVVFIPVTATFQSGLLVYWCFNSMLSLVQMMIFKIPGVRTFFKLPKPVTATPKVQIPNVVYSSNDLKTRKAISNKQQQQQQQQTTKK